MFSQLFASFRTKFDDTRTNFRTMMWGFLLQNRIYAPNYNYLYFNDARNRED